MKQAVYWLAQQSARKRLATARKNPPGGQAGWPQQKRLLGVRVDASRRFL
jgi:hypothetical protein